MTRLSENCLGVDNGWCGLFQGADVLSVSWRPCPRNGPTAPLSTNNEFCENQFPKLWLCCLTKWPGFNATSKLTCQWYSDIIILVVSASIHLFCVWFFFLCRFTIAWDTTTLWRMSTTRSSFTTLYSFVLLFYHSEWLLFVCSFLCFSILWRIEFVLMLNVIT